MLRKKSTLSAFLLALTFMFGSVFLSSCPDNRSVGDKIEDTVEDAGDEIEDVGEGVADDLDTNAD